jgi:uncharacterized C2H2 Zn-finger protein
MSKLEEDYSCPECGLDMGEYSIEEIDAHVDEHLGHNIPKVKSKQEEDECGCGKMEEEEEAGKAGKHKGGGKHYPFEKCVADRKRDGYSEDSAKRICGAIRWRSGHHSEEGEEEMYECKKCGKMGKEEEVVSHVAEELGVKKEVKKMEAKLKKKSYNSGDDLIKDVCAALDVYESLVAFIQNPPPNAYTMYPPQQEKDERYPKPIDAPLKEGADYEDHQTKILDKLAEIGDNFQKLLIEAGFYKKEDFKQYWDSLKKTGNKWEEA